MITSVAIKDTDGTIWVLPKPNRHHNVIHHIHLQKGQKEAWRLLGKSEQGFMNDKGEFLNRENAALEAWDCKQVLGAYNPAYGGGPIPPKDRRGEPVLPKILFSEDLW